MKVVDLQFKNRNDITIIINKNAEIEKNKGTQFDPQVADVMLSMIDEDTRYLMRELR